MRAFVVRLVRCPIAIYGAADRRKKAFNQPYSCRFDRTFHNDRYLLHPTEGMGITDEGTRRQILEALDSLKE